MSHPLLDAPTDFTPFELTEWVETYMFLNQMSALSRAALIRLFPAGQSPDSAEIDQLFAEVRSRSEQAPSIYPFRDVDESVEVDDNVDPTVYYALLLLSIEAAPYRTGSLNSINPSFELLTREALISYLGDGAQGRRFGWPNGDGRPEHLGDAVEWLATEMGLGVGVVWDEVDVNDKDGGIDVAAWKPFADGGPSFAVYLAQCTIQSTYERKASDVVPEKWTAWISFGKGPDTALSVPYAIPPDAKVRTDLKYRVQLLLDRIRLIGLLEKRSLGSFPEMADMRTWTELELERTLTAASTPGGTTPRMAKRRRPRSAPRPGAPREAA